MSTELTAIDFVERLVESSRDGIVALDTQYVVTLYNSAMERITGILRDRVIGRNCFDVFPFLREVGEDSLVDGAMGGLETEARDRVFSIPESGRVGHYEARYSPFTDREGRVIGIIGVIRDITERRAMEQRLLHAQKLETAGRLAGGIAHDFNNVLTVILGEVALSQRAALGAPELRAAVQRIGDSAQRAASLTRQLLAFSRQNFVSPTVFPSSELLDGVGLMVQHLVGEGILFSVVQPDADPCIRADRGHAEQILTNLIVNARDAMPRGGSLTVEVATVALNAPLQLSAGTLAPGEYVTLSVQDTGGGIPKEVLARAFEPFYTTKEQGTGLGLCTSLGMAQQMGGQLRIESVEGAGTCATVYLPYADPVEPHESGERPIPGGAETILLVEDEERLRDVTAELLRELGYFVHTAVDGVAALEFLSAPEVSIDLIVSDIVMPRMGGRELVEQVREIAPSTAILLMTGYTDDKVLRQRVQQDGWPILSKPFDRMGLAEKLREVLDGRAIDGRAAPTGGKRS